MSLGDAKEHVKVLGKVVGLVLDMLILSMLRTDLCPPAPKMTLRTSECDLIWN